MQALYESLSAKIIGVYMPEEDLDQEDEEEEKRAAAAAQKRNQERQEEIMRFLTLREEEKKAAAAKETNERLNTSATKAPDQLTDPMDLGTEPVLQVEISP